MGGFVLCSLLSLEPWDVGLGLGALPALQRLWCGVLRHSKPRCVPCPPRWWLLVCPAEGQWTGKHQLGWSELGARNPGLGI